MVDLAAFRTDVDEEVSTILNSSFAINATETIYVPHSDDSAITFPNLDEKYQNVKVIETTVLYVDMRRSTELSLKHRRETVARLYSAFVRAMTRCAKAFGGEVRGIIGDRVMMLFDQPNCYANAVDTAVSIHSVCTYIINTHFRFDEVSFGIGIDYGRMLATKTGIRRHGSAQGSYHSLVWLGRPANIASKLTDNANKPAEHITVTKARVAYASGLGGLFYQDEWPSEVVKQFTYNGNGSMIHSNPAFHSWTTVTEQVLASESSPAILMTKCVLDGYRNDRPNAIELQNGWYSRINRTIPNVSDEVYGGNVIYLPIRGW